MPASYCLTKLYCNIHRFSSLYLLNYRCNHLSCHATLMYFLLGLPLGKIVIKTLVGVFHSISSIVLTSPPGFGFDCTFWGYWRWIWIYLWIHQSLQFLWQLCAFIPFLVLMRYFVCLCTDVIKLQRGNSVQLNPRGRK